MSLLRQLQADGHDWGKYSLFDLLTYAHFIKASSLSLSVLALKATKFNKVEWVPDHHPGMLVHQFSLHNAFWFSLAALFQQGSDISPRFKPILLSLSPSLSMSLISSFFFCYCTTLTHSLINATQD